MQWLRTSFRCFGFGFPCLSRGMNAKVCDPSKFISDGYLYIRCHKEGGVEKVTDSIHISSDSARSRRSSSTTTLTRAVESGSQLRPPTARVLKSAVATRAVQGLNPEPHRTDFRFGTSIKRLGVSLVVPPRFNFSTSLACENYTMRRPDKAIRV